jgi:hypothetical protein
VDNLHANVKSFEVKISDYKKQINNLEIEWAFLTRPSRLRDLSGKYLTNTANMKIAQIKSDVQMGQFFIANYEKSKTRQFALVE